MTRKQILRLLAGCISFISFTAVDTHVSHALINEIELNIVGSGPNCDSGRTFNWNDLPNSADPYSTMKDLVPGNFYKLTNNCGGGQYLSLRRGSSQLLGLLWYSNPLLSDLVDQDFLLGDGSSAYLYIPQDFSVLGSNPGDFRTLIRKPADGSFPVFLPVRPFTVGNPIFSDRVAPTVVKVTTTANDQTYSSTQEILIQVHFSETVIVATTNGSPTLTLAVRDTGHPATYQSGSGTAILTFSYVINSGDNSDHLDFVGTSSLLLNQAAVQDNSANQANLTLPIPGSLDSLSGRHHVVIDTDSPSVEISRSGNQILTAAQDDLVFFNLTENSSNFSISCVEISGGSLSSFLGSGDSYSAVVTPSENSSGNVVVTVSQNSFSDAIGNRNLSPVVFSIPFNTSIPEVVETPDIVETPDVVVRQTPTSAQTDVSNAVKSPVPNESIAVVPPRILARKMLPRVGGNAAPLLYVSSVFLLCGLSLIATSRKRILRRQQP